MMHVRGVALHVQHFACSQGMHLDVPRATGSIMSIIVTILKDLLIKVMLICNETAQN